MFAAQPSERNNENLAGWFWSVKVDGLRCLWTGSQFLAHEGEAFDVPADWVSRMPPTPLDGELFAGSWSQTSSAVQRGDWSAVRFHIFDAPAAGDLYERLATIPADLPSFCVLLSHKIVFSTEHALEVMQAVARAGGEGIVVRDPNAPYVAGETRSWLKLKPVQDDECVIVEPIFKTCRTIPDGYVAQWNGKLFKLPADGKMFASGDVVTFFCRGIAANGKPRHPHPKGLRLMA